MLLVTGIFTIVVGALAAASFIAAKQPNAQAAIDKLVPFQGIIGIIAGLWGVWGVIQALLSIGSIGLGWIVLVACSLLMVALGFILGYGLISKYAMKTPEAMAKGQAMRLALARVQTALGLIAIGLGVWAIVQAVL
jgi:hypothetical protein